VSTAALAALFAHRVLQRWNQTGQKHAGAPDIVTTHLLHHPTTLWALFGLAYLALAARLAARLNANPVLGAAGALLAVAPAAAFKVAFTAADSPELFFWLQGPTVERLAALPLVPAARAVFASLALLSALVLAAERTRRPGGGPSGARFLGAAHGLLAVLLVTQTRAHNAPVFLLLSVQRWALARMRLSPAQLAVSTILLGHAAFFALGGSNAMSSVDLSSAYNGVSGYNVLVVGVLVFVGNWAGPLWWAVAALEVLAAERERRARPAVKARREWVAEEHGNLAAGPVVPGTEREPVEEERSPWADYFAVATVWVSGSLLAVMAACLAMRMHLFIWTVFSPKYLYSMAWTLGFHYLVSLGLCGGLWSLQRA
jgi:ethanolaminephosphotransferase